MAATKIEWATHTVNLLTGCTKVSEGCKNCFAERVAWRLAHNPKLPPDVRDSYAKAVAHGRWSNEVTTIPGALDNLHKLCQGTKPKRIFVQSMGDLFHEEVTVTFLEDVLAVITNYPQHTFMILTKRAQRLNLMTQDRLRVSRTDTWPIRNLWLGVTAENQEQADKRIPILLSIPAAVRFVSIEPCLGPVDLGPYLDPIGHCCGQEAELCHCLDSWPRSPEDGSYQNLDWVIVGAETGPHNRTMYLQWARQVRDDCQAAGVPFFFKKNTFGFHELDGVVHEALPEVKP
jgi:protein gp37